MLYHIFVAGSEVIVIKYNDKTNLIQYVQTVQTVLHNRH